MQPKDFESQKCGIHGTWMTVYNDEGTYFPPILCLSRSKTIDKDYRSKTISAALPSSSSAAPMLQLSVGLVRSVACVSGICGSLLPAAARGVVLPSLSGEARH